jgi:hypothetical protein
VFSRNTIVPLIIVFKDVNDNFKWLNIFTYSEPINFWNLHFSVLFKVKTARLECVKMFIWNDEDSILLKAVPIEFLDITTVKN